MKAILVVLLVSITAACNNAAHDDICREIGDTCTLGGTCYPEAHQRTMSRGWIAQLTCWIPCDANGTCAHVIEHLWDDRDMRHEIPGIGCFCVPEIYK